MKKTLSIASTLLILNAGSAFACEGPDCYATGNFDIKASAMDGAIDGGIMVNPGYGISGGGAAAGGLTKGSASADIDGRGEAEGYIGVVGGGIVDSHQWRTNYDFSHTQENHVGSMSEAKAVTDAHMDLTADSDQRWKRTTADGDFFGIAGQGTADFSAMKNGQGFTGGLSAQGSAGFIKGGVDVESGWFNAYYPDQDVADAKINMMGNTYSHSMQEITIGNGVVEKTLQSTNIAQTDVQSSGYDTAEWYEGNDAYVRGGFIAGGIAANKTVMEGYNGVGKASAKASYFGAGELGCDFSGSAFSRTNVTVVKPMGMKGSIIYSSSSASASTSGESRPQ